MEATAFAESNAIMDTPEDENPDRIIPLNVFMGMSVQGSPVVISCWKITKEELEVIAKTGRIWIWVYGEGMPPLCPSVQFPFEKAQE